MRTDELVLRWRRAIQIVEASRDEGLINPSREPHALCLNLRIEARDDDVEIVLESHFDGVVEGELNCVRICSPLGLGFLPVSARAGGEADQQHEGKALQVHGWLILLLFGVGRGLSSKSCGPRLQNTRTPVIMFPSLTTIVVRARA